jgi:hypothetical protein
MNVLNKIKGISKKVAMSTLVTVTAVSTACVPAFAAGASGNADLDTLIQSMTDGLDTVKKGGLYIVGAIIVVAVVFLGARWLWNMFRSWLSRAQ